mgnify:CR=1 FL=1
MIRMTDTFSGDRVPSKTKWFYSSVGIGRDAAYTLVSLFLMTYVQFTLGNVGGYEAKMAVIMAIIVLARIWDGVNDPMMGTIIENTHSKLGKYKPWILFGAITNSVVLYLMFTVRPTGWWYVVFFGVFYLLWEMTFTMNDIAYWSMLPSLTSEEKQRNELTTLVSVFASVGAFAVGGLVPMLFPGDAINRFSLIALVIAAVFLISQLLLVFNAKERQRDSVAEKAKPKTSIKEMFIVIWKNRQLWWMMIVITLYYLGSALLNAFGLNYFYFAYDYGTGGSNMFLFTVVYAVGTIVSQVIFPLLTSKFSRKQLLSTSFIAMVIGYTALFTMGFIATLTGTPPNMLVMSVLGMFIFAGQGVFYLVLLIMVTNTIEYNEWTTGERKESIIFASRPFAAKISSSLQALIVYVILFAGGIYSITKGISDLEIDAELLSLTRETVITSANALINNAPNLTLGVTMLLVGMCLIPLALITLAFIIIKKKYIIDEKFYQQMVKEIEARKNNA